METLKSCPICDHSLFTRIRECIDYTVSRETFTIVACDSCGFQFTNPRPEAREIARYYESEEYISHTGKTSGIIGRTYRMVRNHTLKEKLSIVRSCTGQEPESTSVLDIGSGTGEFLNICKKAGMKSVGAEPSDKARSFSIKEYGLDIRLEAELSTLEAGSFDVITLWHVLEHVHNLKDRVNEIHRLLKTDGAAIIALPNRESDDALRYGREWAAYDVPRHLYHFTRRDAQALFEATSFRLERTIPMKFDAFYVSILSDKNRGKSNLICSTWNGLLSNLKASTQKGTWSSQIYVFRKRS